MARAVSNETRRALYAQESDTVIAVLMTFSHPELTEPVRISTDTTERITLDPLRYGTISRGETYYFVPVSVVLPDEIPASDPRAALEIDNTDRALIEIVRSISSPPSVTLELINASFPDVVEIEFPQMIVSGVTYDAEIVTFQLVVDGLFTEPFPATKFLPNNFPGLF